MKSLHAGIYDCSTLKVACRPSLFCCVVVVLAGVALHAQQSAERRVIPLGIYDREGPLLLGLKPEQIPMPWACASSRWMSHMRSVLCRRTGRQ